MILYMEKHDAISLLERAKAERRAADEWSSTAQAKLQDAIHVAHSEAGMTHVEIGQVLGVHRNTVMNWCGRATR